MAMMPTMMIIVYMLAALILVIVMVMDFSKHNALRLHRGCQGSRGNGPKQPLSTVNTSFGPVPKSSTPNLQVRHYYRGENLGSIFEHLVAFVPGVGFEVSGRFYPEIPLPFNSGLC